MDLSSMASDIIHGVIGKYGARNEIARATIQTERTTLYEGFN